MRVALKVREVPVPDLRNHTVAEATDAAAAEGLILNVDESGRLDPKVPSGKIALQEPAPGTITRRQRSIKVWLSRGPRVTVIPSLTGESERSAELRLQEDGLAVTSIAEVRSAEYPSGAVIAQEPPGAAQGTVVFSPDEAEEGTPNAIRIAYFPGRPPRTRRVRAEKISEKAPERALRGRSPERPGRAFSCACACAS